MLTCEKCDTPFIPGDDYCRNCEASLPGWEGVIQNKRSEISDDLDVESTIYSELFSESEQAKIAAEEMKSELEPILKTFVNKYGRIDTSDALKIVHREFRIRRYINPYPIPDEDFEFLVEATEGERIQVGDRTQEQMARIFVLQFRKMDDTLRAQLGSLLDAHGANVLYALVDLMIPDVYVEERNEYVETITSALLAEMA